MPQGSGKTFAFLLPVVASFFAPEYLATSEELEAMGVVMDPEAPEGVRSQRVIDSEIDDQRGCMPRAIILAPTRELASQIAVEARKLIHNSDVKSVVVYGGADIRAQVTHPPTTSVLVCWTRNAHARTFSHHAPPRTSHR